MTRHTCNDIGSSLDSKTDVKQKGKGGRVPGFEKRQEVAEIIKAYLMDK